MAVFGLIVLCLATIVTFLGRIIDNAIKKVRNINKLGGPRAYFPVGNVHQFKPEPDDWFEQIIGCSVMFQKERVFVTWMVWKPFVVISGADEAELVLGSQKHIEKGASAYHLLHEWLGLGLLTNHAETWRPRRKLLTPTFHYDILKDFVEVFNQQSKIFISKLQAKSLAGNGAAFDVSNAVTHCALDIICESAMGRNVNAQNSEENEYVNAVSKLTDIIVDRSKRPYLWPDLIFRFFGRKKEQEWALKILHGFTNKVIYERKRERDKQKKEETEKAGKRRLAFLDLLLEMADKGKLTMKDVREEVDTFMFEGHDTTSSAMNWTLHLLGCSPKDQARVHQEVDAVFGEDGSRDVSFVDLKSLPFLECCIKEALRLYPSVPLYTRTLMEDLTINGCQIPKGVEVAINAYRIHRDPEHWKDPEMFIPERFLPTNCSNRHAYSFIPFSAGSRNCIGQRFALMELKTVLAWVFRSFEITSIHRRDQIRPKGEIILRPSQGVWLKVVPRNGNQINSSS